MPLFQLPPIQLKLPSMPTSPSLPTPLNLSLLLLLKMDQPTMPSLLLFLLLLFNGPPSLPLLSSSLHLPLIHRHSFLSPNATQIQRVHDLLRSDHIRLQMISQRPNIPTRRQMRRISSPSAALPISSGSYASTGQYFVRFRVGSPSQQFLLVADTGSDLTWMNCRYRCRRNCPRRIDGRRFFNAGRSKSFKTIPCSTPMCQNLPFSLARCPTQRSPCHYDYRYTDGSSAKGIFANETVTVGLTNGRQLRLPHVVVGCSSSISGSSFRTSDGILGLGYSNYSIVVQASKQLGGKFSYCLVDHLSPKNVSSYLTLGGHVSNAKKVDLLGNMRYTKLVLDVFPALYAVNVGGISIGDVMLRIPLSVWDLNDGGGAIVDSGTSLTLLAKPAYEAVMTALKVPLTGFKRVEVKPFEFCFSSVGFNETLVPKLAVHFADSARFEPPVKSYVIDVSKGVKCLGFMANGWPGISIIGNIMQQNFMWEFDIVGRRLGFAPSTCRTTTSH